jgi:hypothetical protein
MGRILAGSSRGDNSVGTAAADDQEGTRISRIRYGSK